MGETRFPFLVVPCCRECNVGLGAKTLWTVRERKEYIKRWLEKRYASYLRIPGWEEDELNEMGHSLQTAVLQGLLIRNQTRQRLRWEAC